MTACSEDIFREVQNKVDKAREAGEAVDYLTFVPDGEPTLDANLGRAIELLRPLGIKIAVITNASLEFAHAFKGELVTETMLVEGVNDGDNQPT